MADVQSEVTVKTFQPTAYAESSWPVVGDVTPDADVFSESRFEFVNARVAVPDPMFENFGEGGAHQYVKSNDTNPALKKRSEEVTALEQEIERLQAQVRESYEEGKAAGRGEAEKESQLANASRDAALKELLQDMQTQILEQFSTLERQSVHLTVALVEKVLGHVVEAQPEYIGSIVRESLRYVGSSKVRKVRVSPQDLEFIEVVGIKECLTQFDFSVSFEADSSIRSGCVVETSDGEIDSRLNEAFEAVKDKIVKSIG